MNGLFHTGLLYPYPWTCAVPDAVGHFSAKYATDPALLICESQHYPTAQALVRDLPFLRVRDGKDMLPDMYFLATEDHHEDIYPWR